MKGTIGALSEGADVLISEGANPEINFSAPQDAFNIFVQLPGTLSKIKTAREE